MSKEPQVHPEVVPGFEGFWAPQVETEETLEKMVTDSPAQFGVSRKAKEPYGVIYNGAWETLNDGVCIAVRRNACALRRSGMPVFLSSLTHKHWNRGIVESCFHYELPKEVLAEVGHLTESQHDITLARILHFVPTTSFLTQYMRPTVAGFEFAQALSSRTIAYMALEIDVFPDMWVSAFNGFGAIAVPCQKSKNDLIKGGIVVPIHVIPHCMGLLDPMRNVRPSTQKGARFLHVGKWEPRKNQHRLIGGFLDAFEPGYPAFLHLHCKPFWGAPPYPATFDESRYLWLNADWVKKRGWDAQSFSKHVTCTWNVTLPRESLAQIYGQHNIYVSSGRVEGFDLCAFDGKLAGHLMVHMGYGGPCDFATASDVKIQYEHASIPPKGYSVPDGVQWPDPLPTHYGLALKRAAVHIISGAPRDQFDCTPYRIDRVGFQLRQAVEQLAKSHNLPTP